MLRSRTTLVITILLAVFVLLAVTAPALAGEKYTLPRNEYAPAAPDPMDGTHMLGAKDKALRKLAAQIGTQNLISGATLPAVENVGLGYEFDVDVSDMSPGGTVYTEHFVVVDVGDGGPDDHGIICVPEAAYESYIAPGSDGYYHFDNPSGSWSHYEDLISPAQLSSLLDEFNTNIWGTMSPIFGTPLPRGDEGEKVWILVHNIIDEAYYDPTVETYVAGYFSSSEDTLAVKNMMHIDSYDWANRTGGTSARPYLYEGVFAHEYQHLLHFDMDPDEESWVDEGLADMAAHMCYPMGDLSHVVYYLVYHPFTALTFFGGGLESYGASYLFQLYLWEKYGGNDFTEALFEDQGNGIEGVQNTLNSKAGGIPFDTVFDNWTVANYVDDKVMGSLYGYDTLNIGTADTWGYSIEYALQRYWYPSHHLKLPMALYSSMYYGAPQPYTAQYYTFNNQKSLTAFLDGDEQAGKAAYSGTQEWCSGQGTWAWKSFYQSFAIPAEGATLSFQTFYDIEEDWDYGYVEVFDQSTLEWTTLQGKAEDGTVLTTGTLPQVQDSPNVPAGREPKDYVLAGNWNAFTGTSGDWVKVNMDLSDFAGDPITIYFRTWQDGAFTLQMMYVDDIAIDYEDGSVDFFDDVEGGAAGWTPADTTDPEWPDTGGWTVGTGLVPNNWQATLLETKWDTTTRYSRGHSASARNFLFFDLVKMRAAVMDPVTQSGSIIATASVTNVSKLTWVYIVSNRADHILNSDYFVGFAK
jgi:hypothetical protein